MSFRLGRNLSLLCNVVLNKVLPYFFNNRSTEKGEHYFVVSGEGIAGSFAHCRPSENIFSRPVVLDKVHIHGRNILDFVPEIPRYCQCLQKHLGHDNSRTEVDIDTTVEI